MSMTCRATPARPVEQALQKFSAATFTSGRGVIENKHSTDVKSPPPPPHLCMIIHP